MSNQEELDKELEELEPVLDVQEGWFVKDKNDAEWCLSKIRQAEQCIEENELVAENKVDILKAQIQRCGEWVDKVNRPHHTTIERMKAYLEPWIKQELENINKNVKEGKRKKKSISLISGKVGYRGTSHTEHNMKELESYIFENIKDFEFCVKVTKEVKLNSLKEKCVEVMDSNGVVSLTVKETGEIIPGYKIVKGEEFYA